MPSPTSVRSIVHNLVKEGGQFDAGKVRPAAAPSAVWRDIRATGTDLWLDTGDVEEAAGLWNAEFTALTTNNTLLNKEVQKGIYDDLVRRAAVVLRAAAPDMAEKELLLEIAFVLNARHGLRLVDRFDAFVSVELHTDLANDVDQTVAYGLRFHDICPERFYVKVPFTPAGLLGARKLAQAGVPVNLTLGFSARQACLGALLAQPRYVNVFMGRLGAVIADNKLGDGKGVGEKATLAAQRELIALRCEGRTNARLIGASMREGGQIGGLAGLDVFTMPPRVAAQYAQSPLQAVTSRVDDDPAVAAAPGVSLSRFGCETLWDVPLSFKAGVDALAARDTHRLEPGTIVEALEHVGSGDLFPRWTEADVRMAATDGKIPVLAHWEEWLASGQIGLDALMNLSALQSFVADQAALDRRISSLLQPG